eukprot:163327_1
MANVLETFVISHAMPSEEIEVHIDITPLLVIIIIALCAYYVYRRHFNKNKALQENDAHARRLRTDIYPTEPNVTELTVSNIHQNYLMNHTTNNAKEQNQINDESNAEEYYKQFLKQRKHKMKFKMVRGILNQCSGDCGNRFAKFIEFCINQNPAVMKNYGSFIETEFYDNDCPIRRKLIELMQNNKCTHKYLNFYRMLKNNNYHPTTNTDMQCIVSFLYKLSSDGYDDILNHIINVQCRVPPKPLLGEIIDNLNQIRFAEENKLKKELDATNTLLDRYYKSEIKQTDGTNIYKLVNALLVERNKLSTLLQVEKQKIKQIFNKKYYDERLRQVQQLRKYERMKKKGNVLTDMEIYALLLYCDHDFYCSNMRKAHRDKLATCQWKNLYSYICSAVTKLHSVFHYKNAKFLRKYKDSKLYHGSNIPSLNDNQQKELILNTITSFTRCEQIAKDFCGGYNGMILQLDNTAESLYNGVLVGADVSWISIHKTEDEVMILPTTFWHFNKIDVNQHIVKYVTSQYKSKEPPLIWHQWIIIAAIIILPLLILLCLCRQDQRGLLLEDTCILATKTVYMLVGFNIVTFIVAGCMVLIRKILHRFFNMVFLRFIFVILLISTTVLVIELSKE